MNGQWCPLSAICRLKTHRFRHIFHCPQYSDLSDKKSLTCETVPLSVKPRESFSGKYLRLAKGNRSVWLEASYIPVSDRRGRVIRVIKIAADISERVHSALEQEAVVNAINRSMAIITFNPEGIVLEANENFVNATGYKRDEIIGKHHRLFCAETLYKSDEYRHFWESLNQGEFF
ncbi:TPA: PAS domain-containing protein, partial [Klebsiella pneumoniae]|nr:PAS domain-containing protein [Klebsiella pneumoniae]HEL4162401.1 PAS domain-containing protein [Klebsiella pneumoniae]HEL4675993.1 PAS domain-containing protein [Klebsiella pneumoniae]HEL7698281.1 PAS domain-containing protein [Klebsiella pneumoniae]